MRRLFQIVLLITAPSVTHAQAYQPSAAPYQLRTSPPVRSTWGVPQRAGRAAPLETLADPRVIVQPPTTILRAPAQRADLWSGGRTSDSIGPRDVGQLNHNDYNSPPVARLRPWSQAEVYREMQARQDAQRALLRGPANSNDNSPFPTPGPASNGDLRIMRDQRESVSGVDLPAGPSRLGSLLADVLGRPAPPPEPDHVPCPGGASCRNLRTERWSTQNADGIVTSCRSGLGCRGNNPEVVLRARHRGEGRLEFGATIQPRTGHIVGSEDQARNGNPPDSARFELGTLTNHMAVRAGLSDAARETLRGVQREASGRRVQEESRRLHGDAFEGIPTQGLIQNGPTIRRGE
jgi:hypothetical protein